MKLTLIDTKSRDKITIESLPFSLGRISLSSRIIDPQAKANLKHVSKDHAQLTFENGSFFIQDSSSLNGTFVNNQKLIGTRVGIKPGDVLSLAQKLDYVIDISQYVTVAPQDNYFLKSLKTGSLINITNFPFYCTSELFKKGKVSEGGDVDCILSFFDGAVYIAPFSNNCQIHVDGKRLVYGHTLLNQQSTISNQQKHSFILQNRTDTEKMVAPNQSNQNQNEQKIVNEDETIYMADATMFMSVFDADDKKNIKNERDQGFGQSPPLPTNHQAKSIIKSKLFLKSIFSILLFTLIITASVFYYRSSELYKANQEFLNNNFESCLIIANNSLEKKRDPKLEDIGKKALIKAISPDYLLLINEQKYQLVSEQIADYTKKTTKIPDAKSILNTFTFVTKVDKFTSNYSGDNGIDDENWKKDILSINREWNKSNNQYQATISEIKQIEPSLINVFDTFFSKINDCREYEIYYINKISVLELKISSLLKKHDYRSAKQLIQDFSLNNPKIANTDKWLNDLSGFITTSEQLKSDDLFELESIGRNYKPETVLFKKIKSDFINKSLPPEIIRKHLLLSKQSWNIGAIDEAVIALKSAPKSQYQNKIESKLVFFQTIQDYQKILNEQNSPPNCIALAELAYLLKDKKTSLLDQYAADLTTCTATAQKTIPDHERKALAAFKQFQKDGGINGQMRMSSNISPKFEELAGLISTALNESRIVKKWSDSFHIILNKDTEATFLEISREHNTQVVRIRESTILSRETKDKKLTLLEPKEVK